MQGGKLVHSVFGSIGLAFPPIAFCLYNSPEGVGLLATDMSWENKLLALDFHPHRIIVETNGQFES